MLWKDIDPKSSVHEIAEDPWGSESPSRKPKRARPIRLDKERDGQGSGNGGRPPQQGGHDLEDMARQVSGQAGEIARRLGSGGIGFVIAVLLILYAATGIYQVGETQRFVETTFGRVSGIGQPGLNWHWPPPIGSRYDVDVSQRTVEIGGAVSSVRFWRRVVQ